MSFLEASFLRFFVEVDEDGEGVFISDNATCDRLRLMIGFGRVLVGAGGEEIGIEDVDAEAALAIAFRAAIALSITDGDNHQARVSENSEKKWITYCVIVILTVICDDL